MKKLLVLLFVSSLIFGGKGPFKYVSPLPDSKDNSRESTIILYEGGFVSESELASPGLISVTGSISGQIDGNVILSSDGKTVIFKPVQKFEPSEKVTVKISPGINMLDGRMLNGTEYSFKITPLPERLDPHFYIEEYRREFRNDFSQGFLAKTDTVPSNFPSISTEVLGETGEGYVFINVSRDIPGVGYYIMMLNNDGAPFYYKECENDYTYDFKIQPNGYLTYAQLFEHHSYTGGGDVVHMVMDNSFTVVDSFKMGNGYVAEAHDFQMLPNGHGLLFGYDLQLMDLTHIGGWPNAKVAQTVVQELDQDKNVVFQWRSGDHYAFEDTKFPRLTGSAFDPIHVNSIIMDTDGNLILTSNGLSEATKISRETGEIIWRLGGKNNMFEWIGDNAEFSNGLHNISRLPNGHIMFFDNYHPASGAPARSVEYDLDEVAMTAELVWHYTPEPLIKAHRRGSSQRLPNGNTIIGWGSASDDDSLAVTEVNAEGEVVFNLRFNHEGMASYRAFRFPFTNGAPAADVTITEVMTGNTYEFMESDTNNTGVKIKINSLIGAGYNSLTVKKYNFAPLEPIFFGKAPIVIPQRIVVSENGINSINADIRFNAEKWGIDNLEDYIVYHRPFEGNGLFQELVTTYNTVTGEIIGTSSELGEFIVARPDFESTVYKPHPFAPADSGSVNQTLPVTIRWTPVGYVTGYTLQVSKDENFGNFVVNEDNLVDAIYTIDNVDNNSTYYWRVNSENDAGTSDWCQTQIFSTAAPFIQVTSPDGGEEWQRGFEYFITWSDNIEEDINISYEKSGTGAWIDVTDYESTGGYKWEIPSNLEPGDYNMRIRSTVDTNMKSVSAQPFSIIDTVTSVEDEIELANDYRLHQNYPNPFNPETKIVFEIPKSEMVTLKVYDVLGREVANLVSEYMNAGMHEVFFSASGLSSGIYFYSIETSGFTSRRKMLLLK